MQQSGALAHAELMIRCGDHARAAGFLKDYLARSPADPFAYRLLGLAVSSSGQVDEAIAHLAKARQLSPTSALFARDLGKMLAQSNHLDEATGHFAHATSLDPEDFEGWLLLGVTAGRLRRFDESLGALRKAHALAPSNTTVTRELAERVFESAGPAEALPLWRKIAAQHLDDVHAQLRLGETLSRLGMHDDAAKSYRYAVSITPESPELWLALGQSLEDNANREGAQAAYQAALDLRPDWPLPLSALLGIAKSSGNATFIVQAEALLSRDDLEDSGRALLAYELGKAHDARGEHSSAFDRWSEANRARRNLAGPMDRDALERWVAEATSTSELPGPTVHHGDHSDQALVFIVGMPRSGTTLTEQILAAHPRVVGCGELPDINLIAQSAVRYDRASIPETELRAWAEGYLISAHRHSTDAQNALRYVDKAPLNFFHLPLIAAMFPKARVIWVRRDPRDIALSIYSQNFSPDARFATDLEDLGHFINAHVRLMRHWIDALPLSSLELSYHALALDPEPQVRRLMNFVGLEWDARCLDFHRSTRGVQTPSRWQVREPVHTRSLDRWRRYEGNLQPLIATLNADAYL